MMGDRVEDLLAGTEYGVWSMEYEEPASRRSFFMEPTIRPGLQAPGCSFGLGDGSFCA
jgi:hypothetical protein